MSDWSLERDRLRLIRQSHNLNGTNWSDAFDDFQSWQQDCQAHILTTIRVAQFIDQNVLDTIGWYFLVLYQCAHQTNLFTDPHEVLHVLQYQGYGNHVIYAEANARFQLRFMHNHKLALEEIYRAYTMVQSTCALFDTIIARVVWTFVDICRYIHVPIPMETIPFVEKIMPVLNKRVKLHRLTRFDFPGGVYSQNNHHSEICLLIFYSRHYTPAKLSQPRMQLVYDNLVRFKDQVALGFLSEAYHIASPKRIFEMWKETSRLDLCATLMFEVFVLRPDTVKNGCLAPLQLYEMMNDHVSVAHLILGMVKTKSTRLCRDLLIYAATSKVYLQPMDEQIVDEWIASMDMKSK